MGWTAEMVVYLIRKLEQFTILSSEEKRALEHAAAQKVRRLSPREDIIHEGDSPRHLNLMLEGWACRYKVLEDGRRQVAAFMVPGDMCDLRMTVLQRMDHSIGCLSHALVAEISADTVIELSDRYPALRRAFWWNSLVGEAMAREWIVNLGRRNAAERMAHLFCEMFVRLKVIGLTSDRAFELPVTQELLSDAMGLSAVHVNRTLMELREANLISLKGKTLTILDPDGLKALALFNADYLHLDGRGDTS